MKKYALLLLLTAAPINTANETQQGSEGRQTILEALSRLQGSVNAPANPPADAKPKEPKKIKNCEDYGCACRR